MRRPFTSLSAAAAAVALITTGAPAGAAPDDAALRAEVVLPPGNSMLYTVDGVIAGEASGDPAAFGDNVDDQREPYWSFEFFDGGFVEECDRPRTFERPVRLCIDGRGVPAVHADTLADAWFGLGVAAADQRLFLMDAIRRTARGTLSELTGPSGVPEDVATRLQTYTEDELERMLAARSPLARELTEAHVAGINLAIEQVRADPSQLPAEYVLLQALPEPFTTTDVAAMGVLMTRTVAAAGGDEMTNVAALRTLEGALGTEEGRAAFEDLVWQEDERASVTVPREEGVFPRVTQTPQQRAEAFATMADLAAELPLELAHGPGTGAFPEPAPVAAPADAEGPPGLPQLPAQLQDAAVRTQVAEALAAFPSGLRGGSFGVVIGPERTADGSTLLMSEPQLGYAPTLLWEVELQVGDLAVRGSTVPGLPVVGIGYTPRTAWAVTTGNSVTIESFIAELRETEDGGLEHRHDGDWSPLSCRTEQIRYRSAIEGVPLGPPTGAVEVEACRTVHGPLVATSEDGTLGRALRYAMWEREVDNLDALLGWNLATDFEEFEAAMRQATWNENTFYADADGRIAYWHPGLHHVRDPRTDLRLPVPGSGEFDGGGFLPFDALPHAVDPAQGYLVNWNNKPAHGWLDGQAQPSRSLPAGRGQRVTTLIEELDARDDWTFAALRELDAVAAARDPRATELLPLLLDLRHRDDLTDLERDALDVLADWDRSATGPGAAQEHTLGETATAGAAWTIFDPLAERLPAAVLGDLVEVDPGLVTERNRVSANHPFDVSTAFNLAMRVLDPDASSLTPSRDYLGGRTATEVLRALLTEVLDDVAAEQGNEEVATWRSDSPMTPVCSATGIVGPCVEMPLLERGTWIHLAGFGGQPGSTTAPPAEEGSAGDEPRDVIEPTPTRVERPLPVTGAGLTLGLLLLGGAAALRSRDEQG